MKQSILGQTQRRSPLLEAQNLNKKSGKKVGVKELAQVLPLTSLIDAFSIIVIYLLIGTQSGVIETPMTPGMKLPMAQNAESLEKTVAILRIQDNRFFLNDKLVRFQDLSEELAQLKKNSSDKSVEIMVQADQNMNYASLDPLIKAGSLAGIEKFKFAVLPNQ